MSVSALRKAVKVERTPEATRSQLVERIVAGLVVFGMVSLFFLVKPNQTPDIEPTQAAIMTMDFRGHLPADNVIERFGHVTSGAAGADVLEVLGATPQDAEAAISALRATGRVNRKRLQPGVALTAHFNENGTYDSQAELIAVSMKPDAKHTILATRRSDGSFLGSVLEARIMTSHRRIAGVIETNLSDAIVAGGGKASYARTFAALFPTDETLSSGGRKGERFDIVYEVQEDERGNHLENGDLVFAAFNGAASSGSWYRHAPSDTGLAEFYDPSGIAGRAFLTRYPVGRAPITSGFGQRTHPLTGQSHLHSGVDFRAPTGTPIYAAGAGRIKQIRFGDGYGRMTIISHPRGYETRYAHMSGYNSALELGDIVKRGDLIGYVGESGSATGPHLHFEIRRHGRFINPMTLDLPSGRDLGLQPELMQAFLSDRADIDRVRGVTENAITPGLQVTPISLPSE